MKTFCYFSVADKDHGKMAATMVASARRNGVKEDFHIWTDLPSIEGAITHPCGEFDKKLYMFKFHFLKNEVSKLNYDYFVFLDADNYFVSHPGNLADLMGDNKVFVQMENDCSPERSKRGDWWSCPIKDYGPFLKENGANCETYYNTNAGFWIVAKEAINEFYERTTKFFDVAHKRGYHGFTEEPALAFVGHIMQDYKKRTFEDTSWLWASDWTGQWKDRLPEYKPWQFEDYMSGEKKMVKPKIVHCMRSKSAMIKEFEMSKETGYWSGHQMLGDVIGFVAAAHLMFVKTGKRQKVWFQESRKGILDYFDGVDWVPKESIPNAIDCGRDPKHEEWPNMNGIKRFYKWMDPTLINPKSFDIHMNGERIIGEKLIGLITHANTQGDIPNHIVDDMVAQARLKYPEHRIVAIGNMDNKYIPSGVEDMRQEKGDITWIVEMVRKLDLLITPQTGPCFIAAGFRVPMWVYRSKEAFWDNVLNYDTYKVEKWWERVIENISIVDESSIKTLQTFKNKYPKIECDLKYLQLLDKRYLSIGGYIEVKPCEKNNDLKVQQFCMDKGLLFFKGLNKYLCINYKKEHNKYEYAGCGSSCRVFKHKNIAIKLYHDFKKDYYDSLIKLDQSFIKFAKKLSNVDIKCDNIQFKVIEEEFIPNDKSLEKDKFISNIENFIKIISKSNDYKKIDLYINNLHCYKGDMYLVDTHERNKSEDNDFALDRVSWKKYKSPDTIVDGNLYKETFSKHNILVYEDKRLKIKEVVNKDFNDYHSINDTIGKRHCDTRIKEFDINDIKDKTILDIGCSMGGMLFASHKLGALKGIGLEYNLKSIEFAKTHCKTNNINNIEFRLQDIDDFDWFRKMEKVDTVFLLSILNTSTFSEKDALISIANRLGKVLYIEGHSGESHLAYMKKLYYHTDYTSFSHKYVTDGLGKRPLIRCGYGGEVIGKKGLQWQK